MLLSQAKRVRRWPIHIVTSLLRKALSIRTRRSLLRSAGSQSARIILTGPQTSLAPLVRLVRVGVRPARHALAAAHAVARRLNAVVLIHLVVEGSRAYWPARFEDT